MAGDITDLRARFRWTADKVDGWTLLDAPTGLLYGDCDDFAITALWIIAGRSWVRLWWMILTFKAVIWHARISSGGHRMLWVKGRGWIDNIHPEWSATPHHKRVFPYLAPVLALSLFLKR